MSLWTAAVSPYGFCVITPLLDALGGVVLQYPYNPSELTAIALGSIIASGFLSVTLPLIVLKFDLKFGEFSFWSLIVLAFFAELFLSPVFAQGLFVYTLSVESNLGRLFLGLSLFSCLLLFISLICYRASFFRCYDSYGDILSDFCLSLSFILHPRTENSHLRVNSRPQPPSIALPVLLSPNHASSELAEVTMVVSGRQEQQQDVDSEFVYVTTEIVDGDDRQDKV